MYTQHCYATSISQLSLIVSVSNQSHSYVHYLVSHTFHFNSMYILYINVMYNDYFDKVLWSYACGSWCLWGLVVVWWSNSLATALGPLSFWQLLAYYWTRIAEKWLKFSRVTHTQTPLHIYLWHKLSQTLSRQCCYVSNPSYNVFVFDDGTAEVVTISESLPTLYVGLAPMRNICNT